MAAVYLDTSALGRVLLGERDRDAILAALAGYEQHVASRILRLELRRLALRHDLLDAAEQLVADVALVPIDEPRIEAAEAILPHSLASLDAIHLATAVELSDAGFLDCVMTYDRRLADGARHHGLTVIEPS